MHIPTGPATPAEQLKAVRDYAQANYTKGGWDMVVECMDDREIKEIIKGCNTRWSAIERINRGLKPLAAYRQEVQNA